ncbi:MAG: hypothetical protein Q7U63_14570 [Polaromonas sp.]|uniref:hypothetical protein n=1 Tax=Polaromonas sp. TaxID=1869339 RepID=UPI0027181C45|nr:hypothetical protein [Polaromonas sp.]MDO9115001.1 hypothetical protein [Polaromonas sp.]MDP1888617.1 hypothetical protein [Polaromonas sp.]MDP2448834.1 hypothetical protein [Polaromonas sp.]
MNYLLFLREETASCRGHDRQAAVQESIDGDTCGRHPRARRGTERGFAVRQAA